MKKILFILSAFIFSSGIVYADCETGYACSLDDMIKQEQQKKSKDIKKSTDEIKKAAKPDKTTTMKNIKTKDYNNLFKYSKAD